MAHPEPVLVGVRQSRGRISVRHVFVFYKCSGNSHLELSTDISAASRRTLHCPPVSVGDGLVFAGARPSIFDSAIDLSCADRFAERLDQLLGLDRLVRRARRVHLVALGMVGSGEVASLFNAQRSTLNAQRPIAVRIERWALEVRRSTFASGALAGAVCLSASDRGFSLHRSEEHTSELQSRFGI